MYSFLTHTIYLFGIISVNNVPTDPFRPSKDSSKGSSFSLFFLFVSQAFSYLLLDTQVRGLVQGIKISQCILKFIDILFADDTLFLYT